MATHEGLPILGTTISPVRPIDGLDTLRRITRLSLHVLVADTVKPFWASIWLVVSHQPVTSAEQIGWEWVVAIHGSVALINPHSQPTPHLSREVVLSGNPLQHVKTAASEGDANGSIQYVPRSMP